MLCVLPFLLSAQNVSVNVVKEKSFVNQIIKDKQAGDRVFVYAGSENNLPDSVYTYYGEEKRLASKAAITYDESGRKVQEKGLTDLDYDGVIGDNEGYKIDYVYTAKGDLIEEEVITSFYENDTWVYSGKVVSVYNSPELYLPIEFYVYDYIEGSWVLDWKTIAIELDDKGRPVVLMDSTTHSDSYISVMRYNITYNEIGKLGLVTTFEKIEETEDEWEPVEKIEYFYDTDGRLTNEDHYDYDYDYVYDEETEEKDWVYEYTTSYAYDEKGNLISEIDSDEDGMFGGYYYTNIYLSNPDANDVILSVQSKIYPNPVSDVLYVTLEGADNAVVTLVNAVGSVVVQQKTNSSVTSIPVQSFAKGYYFLIVQTDKGVKTHKIIIQ